MEFLGVWEYSFRFSLTGWDQLSDCASALLSDPQCMTSHYLLRASCWCVFGLLLQFKLCDLSGGYRLVPYSGKFIPGIFNDSIAKSLQEDCPDPQTLFSILSDFQLVTGNRETVTKKGHSEAVPDILGYDLVFKDKRRAASAACWKGMVRPCLPNPILHTFTNAGSINKRGNVVNARPVERIIKP